MFAKSIIIAACAAALFVAGCGNKEAKEKADKDVAFTVRAWKSKSRSWLTS